jgi:SAM-dependent methyltransferase
MARTRTKPPGSTRRARSLPERAVSLTYDFVIWLAQRYAPAPARLLDFGCGGGEIVAKAVAAGYDAFGVDTYQDHWQQYAPAAQLQAERIHRIAPDAALPFGEGEFDIVVSNQVFEHIRDLAPIAEQLARLLRPGGVLIAVFPSREVLVEPHLKAPFVHWFSPGSAKQRAALQVSHLLRLNGRPAQERNDWVDEGQRDLRDHIFYRKAAAAIDAVSPWFALCAREEANFLRHRLARHPRLARAAVMPRVFDPLLAAATLRLANAVLVFKKR